MKKTNEKANIKILIIGSGAMGSSLANVLKDNHFNDLTIYGIDEQELNALKKGANPRYFPKTSLHKFKVSNCLKTSIKDVTHIILAIPSSAIKDCINKILPLITKKVLIINVAKGFDLATKQPLHQMISALTTLNPLIRGVVSLIGPSHAEEIVLRKITVINAVSNDELFNQEVISLFDNNYLHVKSEHDVIGANVGAMYKNIIAIFVGMIDSYDVGVNTRAAILTYALGEMIVFNRFMNGKDATIYGLNGLGDLLVTATSPLSRNYIFGLNYREKKEKKTIEGLKACEVVYNLARTQSLKLPIVNILYKILFENKSLNMEIWDEIFK